MSKKEYGARGGWLVGLGREGGGASVRRRAVLLRERSLLLYRFSGWSPEYIFIATIFLLPFLNWMPHPTILLVVAVLFGELLWLWKWICGQRELFFGPTGILLLLFAFLYAMGGSDGLYRAVLLLSFFPLTGLFASERYQKKALRALCASVGGCAVYGIWQYFFTEMELRWVDVSRFADIGGRVTSVFSNPNVLAVCLLIGFPMTVSLVLSERGVRAVLYAFFALADMGCLLLTWSRGAWLGGLLQGILFLTLLSSRGRRLLLWGGFAAGMWLPFLPHSIQNRFGSITLFQESSIRYRLYTWRGTLRMIASHPLGIGVGARRFSDVYRQFAVSGTERVPHTHHLLLQICTELGIHGAICFLTVLLLLFWGAAHCLKAGIPARGRFALVGSVCAVAGCLVMGMFDYVWYHSGVFWLFWVSVAAVGGTIRCERENKENEEMGALWNE